jgi:cytochrome c oxidase assembly factor CtaG
MQNNEIQVLSLLSSNIHLIIISIFGGLVLFGLKVTEHFMRAEQDKLPIMKYVIFFLGLLIFLPILGAGVTSVYIINGDKLSSILALQVGLTSPAIVQSLIIAAANGMAKRKATSLAAGQ